MLKTYWKDNAVRVFNDGFQVLPLHTSGAKAKRPVMANWTRNLMSVDDVTNGRDVWGVGILTGVNDVVAIDVDVYDEDVADDVAAYIKENFGELPCRVGSAPKSLYVCRVENGSELSKLTSSKYMFDGNKKPSQIEILARGQQFAAFSFHSELVGDYTWTADLVKAEHLPVLTVEQLKDVCEYFEDTADFSGGEYVSGSSASERGEDISDLEQLVVINEDIIDIQIVRDGLEELKNVHADYDRWLKVGCATWSATGGSDEGKDLFREWSFKCDEVEHYDDETFDKKWASFAPTASRRTTWASVAEMLKVQRGGEAGELIGKIKKAVEACDSPELLETRAAKLVRDNFDTLQGFRYGEVVKVFSDRFSTLLGYKPKKAEVEKMLKPKRKTAGGDRPEFAEDWAFITTENKFINLNTKRKMVERAFNIENLQSMQAIDPEEMNVANFLSKKGWLTTVAECGYTPQLGEHAVVNHPVTGELIVNTYVDTGMKLNGELTEEGEKAIELFLTHIKKLIPDDKEREIFINYLAHNFQFKGKKIPWSIALYGVQGNGKSLFKNFSREALGRENVTEVSPEALKEKHTGWALDNMMVFIEEVYIAGNERHKIMDKLKPFLSDPSISVRAMNTDTKTVENVANYIMTTNHENAIPVDDGDRRYMIINTLPKTTKEVESKEYQEHIAAVYDAMWENCGAIRHYFENIHVIDESFFTLKRAPMTKAKQEMKEASISAAAMCVRELLENEFSEVEEIGVLDVKAFHQRGADRAKEGRVEYLSFPKTPSQLGRILNDFGFMAAQKEHRVKIKGVYRRFRIKNEGLTLVEARERAKDWYINSYDPDGFED